MSSSRDSDALDGWRALLGPRFLGTSTLLAGGVALYATNEFLTVSLLPSAIADIGGERLYAWVTTLYLVGSVVAASTVNAMLLRAGARMSFLLGLAVFGTGSVVCAAAPGMLVLLVGRTLQGAAGGLLAGLGYALINTALPRSLWTRASALVSAMWGVATVVGPAAGGLFAQFGLWRWAFGVMAMLTLAMAVLVPVVLPAGRVDPGAAAVAESAGVVRAAARRGGADRQHRPGSHAHRRDRGVARGQLGPGRRFRPGRPTGNGESAAAQRLLAPAR